MSIEVLSLGPCCLLLLNEIYEKGTAVMFFNLFFYGRPIKKKPRGCFGLNSRGKCYGVVFWLVTLILLVVVAGCTA